MTNWWNALGLQLQVFYGIGIISAVVLVFQMLLLLIGVGGDDADVGPSADLDLDTDSGADGGGLHVLSVRSITAFFAGFGWAGVIASGYQLETGWVLLIALGVGTVFMMMVYYLMRGLYGLRDSGTLNYRNAIGQIGTVYISIPPAQSGTGQIQVMVQGALRTVAACSNSGEKLGSKTRVMVVGLADQRTVLVEAVGSAANANSNEG